MAVGIYFHGRSGPGFSNFIEEVVVVPVKELGLGGEGNQDPHEEEAGKAVGSFPKTRHSCPELYVMSAQYSQSCGFQGSKSRWVSGCDFEVFDIELEVTFPFPGFYGGLVSEVDGFGLGLVPFLGEVEADGF